MPDFKLNDRDMIEGIFGFGSHVFFFSLLSSKIVSLNN